MAEEKTFSFKIELNAKDLWIFSMYHSYKGLMGIFNVLLTMAALYVLIMNWPTMTAGQKALMILCVLMFTVIQPSMLYLKAKKQAQVPAVKEPMELIFSKEKVVVNQCGQTGELTWDQVGRVEGGPSMVIVYMDRIHAYLVPRRVMGEQEASFRQLVRESLPKVRCKRV